MKLKILIKRKPDNRLTPDELALYIESNDKDIVHTLESKLRHYQKILPESIHTCAVGRDLKICLDKDFLDRFCELAMLKKTHCPIATTQGFKHFPVIALLHIGQTL